MSEGKDTSLATTEPKPLGIPMMPIEQLKLLTAYVNDVKKALMREGKDYIIDGNRQYTARSGFAKLHQGFILSDDRPEITKILEKEPVEYTFKHMVRRREKTETFTTDIFGFEALVRVVNLETGRYAWGEGACTISELAMTNNLSPKWYHRALGTAKTRAWNRAVSNYVGSAEVSAEEMGLVYTDDEAPPKERKTDKKPEKKTDKPVKVQDFAKPVELQLPEWGLADELNRTDDSWSQGKDITEAWMKEAGFNLADYEITVDGVKIKVTPLKAIPMAAQPDVNGVMLAAGFSRSKGIWRLNRSEVVG